MRYFALFSLCCLLVVGCGGSSEPSTLDSSEIDEYVTENADAVAHQEDLSTSQEEEDDSEE